MNDEHLTPIRELRKNFIKLLNSGNISENDLIEIKNDIDDINWKINKNMEFNNRNDFKKQKYIDSKLLPAVLLFATTYSMQLSEEYDSIYSLSDPSDGI